MNLARGIPQGPCLSRGAKFASLTRASESESRVLFSVLNVSSLLIPVGLTNTELLANE